LKAGLGSESAPPPESIGDEAFLTLIRLLSPSSSGYLERLTKFPFITYPTFSKPGVPVTLSMVKRWTVVNIKDLAAGMAISAVYPTAFLTVGFITG